MPKPIDPKLWEEARSAYASSTDSYAAIALRFGISKRAVEKKGAEEGWEALRSAAKIAASPQSKSNPPFKGEPRKAIAHQHSAARGGTKIDELQILEDAIERLSLEIQITPIKSAEAGATAIARLLEVRRGFLPPTTAEEIADLCHQLDISPKDFIRALNEKWQGTA